MDTEFIRTDTFYPIPALYQVTHLDAVVLLDVLAIDDWQFFSQLLSDPDIVKVMHACTEDMEVFEVHLDVLPVNVFDTQLAHAFVSNRFSISYAGLVEEIVDVKLPKHSTRSNWLKRPLTQEQLQYASEDVEYLIPIHDELCDKLERTGRMAWFAEETAARPLSRNGISSDYYKSMRGARRMDPRQLSLLQAITTWREEKAREKNVPRGRVIRDEHLLRLAERRNIEVDDLYDVLPPRVARRYQEDLIEASESVRDHADDRLPQPLDSPLTQSQGELIKKLKAIGNARAEELGMAEEMLARRRDLEACLRFFLKNGELPKMYQGWRADIIAQEYLDVLQSYEKRR